MALDSETGGAPSRATPTPVAFGRMLVWMDLEMTGLDPATEVIVEIATLIKYRRSPTY